MVEQVEGVEEEKEVDNHQWTPVNIISAKILAKEEEKVLSEDEII